LSRVPDSQLEAHIKIGDSSESIARCFSDLLDPTMNWADVGEMIREWDGQSALKE
jgi:L-lactate dehydrogenase (cytochrome)